MVFGLGCLFNEKSKVKNAKPVAGLCSRCGAGAFVVDVQAYRKFLFIEIRSRSWRAIVCSFCGAVLKSYK